MPCDVARDVADYIVRCHVTCHARDHVRRGRPGAGAGGVGVRGWQRARSGG